MKIVTQTVEKIQEHPATNTTFFRWWMAIPIALFLLLAWRERIVEFFSPDLMMAPTSMSHEAGDAVSSPPSEWIGTAKSFGEMLSSIAKGLGEFASTLSLIAWLVLRIRKGQPPIKEKGSDD